jgi:large repetitive protein
LDVSSVNKGFLPPRMTTEQRNAIVNPALGLLIYNISSNCFNYYSGGSWEGLGGDPDLWFADTDSDGFGNSSVSKLSCVQPLNYVNDSTDCNDLDSLIHPGATDICDGIDNNCDGYVDNGSTFTFYLDSDNDGYGLASSFITGDCTPPPGYVSNNTDCDDNNVFIYPNATELCNNLDDNCNSLFDENFPLKGTPCDGTDSDNCTNGTWSCSSDGHGLECINENQVNIIEICDGIDNDCDSEIDEGTLCGDYPHMSSSCNGSAGCSYLCDENYFDCNGILIDGCETSQNNLPYFYLDNDGDGYGTPDSFVRACTAPIGYRTHSGDCDDNNPGIHPWVTENCSNAVDDNCDDLIDCVSGYEDPDCACGSGCPDSDADGYPDILCGGTDCNDNDNTINPGASDVCGDLFDSDCDGCGYYLGGWTCDEDNDGLTKSEEIALGTSECLRDSDFDGLEDGVEDADQDGVVDAGETNPALYDSDNDGANDGADCSPLNPNIHPGAIEICNDGLDNDCDNLIDGMDPDCD